MKWWYLLAIISLLMMLAYVNWFLHKPRVPKRVTVKCRVMKAGVLLPMHDIYGPPGRYEANGHVITCK